MITNLVALFILFQSGSDADLFETVRTGPQRAALLAVKKLEAAGHREKLLPLVEERWKNSPVAGVESDGTFTEEVPLILFKMKDARADAVILRHFMDKGIVYDAEQALMKYDLDRYARIRLQAIEKTQKSKRANFIAKFEVISFRTDKYDNELRKYSKQPDPVGHTARLLLKNSIVVRKQRDKRGG